MRARHAMLIAAAVFAVGFVVGDAQPVRSTGAITCADFADGSASAAVIDGYLWRIIGGDPPERVPAPIPGGSPAIACSVEGVVLENGDSYQLVWNRVAPTAEWSYRGNLLTGKATAAARSTWGSVKGRWR